MPKIGTEGTHISSGWTISELDVQRMVAGPNGVFQPNGIPNVIVPQVCPFPIGAGVAGTVFSANDARGVRAVASRDGTIVEFAVFVTVSNGNLDIGVYDHTVTTKARLGSCGSTAVGTVNTWQTIAPTAPITVFRGQVLDLAISTSSATATFLSAPAFANLTAAVLPTNYWSAVYTDAAQTTLGGATPRLAWALATSHPLPATITDASLGGVTSAPIILARMS